MNSENCNNKLTKWGICQKSNYDQRIIILFTILTCVALAVGILVIVLIKDNILKAVLAFTLGAVLSVSLRSVVAELIQYFRSKKKAKSPSDCNKTRCEDTTVKK